MSTRSTHAKSPDDVADEPANLFDLLSAYQYLQTQNLRMTARLSTDLGISPTDLRVLVMVFSVDHLSPKDIARALEHTTGSVTVLVDRLEKSGHLQRRPHPTDRRSQTLHLTDTGRRVVDGLRDVYQASFDGVFTGPHLREATRTLRLLGDALEPPAHPDLPSREENLPPTR